MLRDTYVTIFENAAQKILNVSLQCRTRKYFTLLVWAVIIIYASGRR